MKKKKNLASTKASLKIQKVQQLESDIKRENFLRENSTAMISDREYLYLLFALKELNPNSKVLGETKLGHAIKNFEKNVGKTLKQMDEEEQEGDAEDADAGEEEISEEDAEQLFMPSGQVEARIKQDVLDQAGIDPKSFGGYDGNTMTKAEVEDLLNKAKKEEPVKKRRTKRSIR